MIREGEVPSLRSSETWHNCHDTVGTRSRVLKSETLNAFIDGPWDKIIGKGETKWPSHYSDAIPHSRIYG